MPPFAAAILARKSANFGSKPAGRPLDPSLLGINGVSTTREGKSGKLLWIVSAAGALSFACCVAKIPARIAAISGVPAADVRPPASEAFGVGSDIGKDNVSEVVVVA